MRRREKLVRYEAWSQKRYFVLVYREGGREGKIGNLPPYLFIREGEKTERDVTSVTCPPAEGVTSLIPRDQVTCPRAKALGQVTWPSGFGKLLYVTSLYPRAYKLPRAIALGSLYALGYSGCYSTYS